MAATVNLHATSTIKLPFPNVQRAVFSSRCNFQLGRTGAPSCL